MYKATTILAVSRGNSLVLAGDGQVSLGQTIVKHTAKKIRKIDKWNILVGFAGSAADGFTLLDRFEAKLAQYSGNLPRAAVELAKDWRSDKYLRRLEAMMIVADLSQMYLVSGAGDVIAPDDGVLAIGSGGNYALSAARALCRQEKLPLSAREIAEQSMQIAAEICAFTNDRIVFEELSSDPDENR